MCQAMEENNKKMKITGVIEYLRSDGKSDDDIISVIVKKFENVTADYVKDLLAPKAV